MPFDSTSKTFIALGTMNTIQAYGHRNNRAVDQAADRVCEISDRMSVFRKGSDINRLNSLAGMGPQKIHPDTFYLLHLAKEYAGNTAGAFDISIRPLSALWSIGSRGDTIPSNEEIQAALGKTGDQHLLLYPDDCAAELTLPGASVDLGGIAKGYAGDEAKRILEANGVRSALLNLGGNIVTVGNRPDGSPWSIGIQNPLQPRGESLFSLQASDCSIVTSGSNERFFIKDGRRYHHILDPKTGFPAQSSLLSVTVICPSGIHADALSTALFVMGPHSHAEFGSVLLERAGAQAVYVTEKLDLFLTPGLYGNHLLKGSTL